MTGETNPSVTIHIDGRPFQADPGRNLLESCLSLGFDLPYFCWHPAMGSVGACRQCAVKQFKDASDTKGLIVMACMTPSTEGMRISIEDHEAREFRASVIEWLMLNHPHDCPVCDEGGECHLQDMTVMTGHVSRRYRESKRTYRNQYLGPFVTHEMNRCIQCYRCVRFYRDIAGGEDLNVFGSRDRLYFGRMQDGTLESEFSGNLVEICPTGVFTDKTLSRHYSRKWDMQSTPSICHHCSLGCNVHLAERAGIMRRVTNRYHRRINGYFLCDRGRFGYEYVNHPRRLRRPAVRTSQGDSASLIPLSPAEALAKLGSRLAEKKRIVGVGSPRASLESNYALKTLVGGEHFFSGMSEAEHHHASLIVRVLKDGPAPSWSVQDVEQADAALILGEDPVHTAPRLALALRQSVRQQPMEQLERLNIPRWQDAAVRTALHGRRGPLYIGSVAGTSLDDVATKTFRASPGDIARLGCAVAHEICHDSPKGSEVSFSEAALIREIAEALASAKRPVVVAGVGTGEAWIIKAAANVAWALRRRGVAAGLAFALQECNTLGLSLLDGKRFEEAAATTADQDRDALLILENDLHRRLETTPLNRWLKRFDPVIVIDHVDTAVLDQADFVFPTSPIACSDGTLVNNEGRAQRYFSAMAKEPDVQESWRWIRDIGRVTSRESFRSMAPWTSLEQVHTAIADEFPLLRGIGEAAPPAQFRISDQKIPRAPHRFSGRTALPMLETIHEPQPPHDPESPLAFSMEGTPWQPPSPLVPFFWSSGWNSNESINKFQDEIGGSLKNDHAGVRLFEPQPDAMVRFFENAPLRYERRTNQLLLVPLPRLFGSEELSARASAIQERMPHSAVVLHPREAERFGLRQGQSVDVSVPGFVRRLSVETDETMAEGLAGLLLVNDGTFVSLPARATLRGAPST
jgi:NADH-quinone oxidoreductase subunit G